MLVQIIPGRKSLPLSNGRLPTQLGVANSVLLLYNQRVTNTLHGELVDSAKLERAIDVAQAESFGFALNAFNVDEVMSFVAQPSADSTSGKFVRAWKTFTADERSEGLKCLQSEILAPLISVSRDANLNYIHMLQPPWDGTVPWHRDIYKDDVAASGYTKGRFRVALNLSGIANLIYCNPFRAVVSHEVAPGTLYVIDNSHNPQHMSKSIGGISVQRNLLILTDVK